MFDFMPNIPALLKRTRCVVMYILLGEEIEPPGADLDCEAARSMFSPCASIMATSESTFSINI
jgi:hypothetical protein